MGDFFVSVQGDVAVRGDGDRRIGFVIGFLGGVIPGKEGIDIFKAVPEGLLRRLGAGWLFLRLKHIIYINLVSRNGGSCFLGLLIATGENT